MILVDLALPGMDGLSLTRQLKGNTASQLAQIVSQKGAARD